VRSGIALLALVAALAGCAPAVVPASPAEAAAIEQRAEQVLLSISGDATQREAARFLNRREFFAPYRECLAEAGFVPEDEYLPQYSGWTPNATEGIWMGELQYRLSPAIAGRAALEASAWEPAKPGSVQARKGYLEASDRCVADFDLDLGDLPGDPPGSQQLRGEYTSLIAEVDSRLGSIEPYARCMAEAGFDYRPAWPDEDGAQGTIMYLAGKAPTAAVAGETTPEWTAFVELETRVLDADERCRADTYRRGLAILAPMLEEFRASHEAELAELAEGWRHTVATAVELGFQA